jgi:hypothetical protein
MLRYWNLILGVRWYLEKPRNEVKWMSGCHAEVRADEGLWMI